MTGRAPPTPMLISVLVPVLDEAPYIERSLAQMRGQVVDGEIEILAIDGGSTDGTRLILERIAREDPRVRVLDNPARRIPQALNIGLAAARGEYVARMDAHTWYPRTYLANGIRRLAQGDAAQVSGPALPDGDDPGSRRVALALRTPLGIGSTSFRKVLGELEVDSGFAGVWRRGTLLRHGGWDERWRVNEDAELAARIRAGGGRIVCLPEMAATYVPRRRLRDLARQYWRYGQYRSKTSRHHPESMRWSHLLAPGVVVTAVAAVAPGPQRTLARAGLACWTSALLVTAGAQVGRESATHVAWLPAVLATMHLSWGAGFLMGSMRFGPPWVAIIRLGRGPT